MLPNVPSSGPKNRHKGGFKFCGFMYSFLADLAILRAQLGTFIPEGSVVLQCQLIRTQMQPWCEQGKHSSA